MKQSFALAMTAAAATAWGPQYEFSVVDLEQFTIGLLTGAIEAEVPDVMKCIQDAETLVQQVEVAYTDFSKENFDGVKAGIEEIGTIVTSISGDLQDCAGGVTGIENLVKMAEGFSSPVDFAYHVGKDLLLHGVDIYSEVNDAVTAYGASNYNKFGEDIGKALAQVLLGEATTGYMLSTHDIELILLGIVEGAIEQALPDSTTCFKDLETTANEIETAVADFKKETFSGVKAGIEEIGTVVKQISTDLSDCKEIVADITKLEKMASTFKSPWSFAYHVGKDLLVDGTDIFAKIDDSIKMYDAGEWTNFGKDVGEAMSLVLIGEKDHEHTLQMSSSEVEKFLEGLVKGALNQELPSVMTCIKDIETTAQDIEAAVADFKKKTFNDTKNGIMELGEAISSVATDLDACASAGADVKELVKMAETFKSPAAFAWNAGKNLLVNGTDIYANITAGITAYDSSDYETFGEDLGKALASVLAGDKSDVFLQ